MRPQKFFYQSSFAFLLIVHTLIICSASKSLDAGLRRNDQKEILISVQEISTAPHEKVIELVIPLSEKQSILKQTLSVSIDSPDVHIGTISYTPQAREKYLDEFLASKEVFNGPLTISILLSAQTSTSIDAH